MSSCDQPSVTNVKCSTTSLPAESIVDPATVTAPHFRDYRLLDIASDIESAYPWARTAPGYEPLDSVLDG
jgi:hypothetical protein